ncbi:MAG: hypothetical protein HN742_15150 [Lentisphaerae bacterium]|jgi:neutral ceramidase|nr:hypothetical protein [Lentisphaerota bacterium]MBT4822320.1 hypothetical protein [Lentisphaerota bacterium]MBT5608497.1 hypothetical protein [Lentisphaerota bacterium]MBT7058505.1 hypothetical protein [Lentisphaerota bacterium]MBT7843214.1 hypothetical protein [Lentisphaerota bacterium]
MGTSKRSEVKDLSIGHARRVVTPRVPVSLAGYFNIRMWTDVLDDLFAQAVVLKQGEEAAALVQFDLIGVSNDFIHRIREACRDISELPPKNILFTATHTHTAPKVRPGREGTNEVYNDAVIAAAAEAVHEAWENLSPAVSYLGQAEDDRFAFNRRYWMKSGEVVTNPPRQAPDIDRPEGPIDPEIGILDFRPTKGPRVLIANVVNHADTTEGCSVSADWPGWLRRTLEKALPDTVVVPITGTSGNINHFDPGCSAEQSGPHVAERIGEGYAETILSALSGLKRNGTDSLQTMKAEFTTGPREIDAAELAQAREHAAKYAFDGQTTLTSEDLAKKSPAALKYFADSLIAVAQDRSEKRFELGAIRIGQAVITMLPGEPFVEIGLALKELVAPTHALIVATLNQDCAYVPNHFNYGRGGYETTAQCSPYSVHTGEYLLSASSALLTQLLAPPSGKPPP